MNSRRRLRCPFFGMGPAAVGLAIVLLCCSWPACNLATDHPRVAVVVGSAAPELERFAARELCEYLAKVYGIQAYPERHPSASAQAVFLIGGPGTNAAVERAAGGQLFPEVSDQGIVLRRTELDGRPALIVGGGSPKATLWAVYELVERWGVRYLIDRDVLPERRDVFELPDLDVVMEPVFRIRGHPTFQDFAASGEAWGVADFRVLIDQLAKMKFTRMNVYAYGWQPYLHWEHKGIKRQSASLWYGYRYPITPDMWGRERFEDADEFWNPDLPLGGSYEETIAAGERQVHSLIEHAHRRGMDCDLSVPTTDFTPEFAPLLKGAEKSSILTGLTVVPGATTSLDDPQLYELATAVLRHAVDTYPEVDYLTVWMPEFRQWTDEYERAWKVLDEKYGIGQVLSLPDLLSAAANRKGWNRGVERAVNMVKGDIAALYFYDRLLRDPKVLEGTLRPDIPFVYGEPAEELYPILDRILPGGWQISAHPENNPVLLLSRPQVLTALASQQAPGILHMTIDDDVLGLVPQLTPNTLHEIFPLMRRSAWAGFIARERFPGDHDWPLAYMARAAWDAEITPDAVGRDLLTAVCGAACGESLLEAFHQVEAATLTMVLAPSRSAIAFPVPRMMMKYWTPGPAPDYMGKARREYESALEAARRAREESTPGGRWYPDFWVGRLEFAAGYVEAVETLHDAATAEAAGRFADALEQSRKALETLRQATLSYARVARTPTDLGAIAILNEYGHRALKAKMAELSKSLPAGSTEGREPSP